MADPIPPITVQTPAAATTITTTVKRRPFWILLTSGLSAVVGVLLLVLDYLQSVSLAGVVTPEKALAWLVGVNVLTIVLRAVAKPQVTQTTVTAADPTKGAQP